MKSLRSTLGERSFLNMYVRTYTYMYLCVTRRERWTSCYSKFFKTQICLHSLYFHPTFCRTLETTPHTFPRLIEPPTDAETVFFNNHVRDAIPKASLAISEETVLNVTPIPSRCLAFAYSTSHENLSRLSLGFVAPGNRAEG